MNKGIILLFVFVVFIFFINYPNVSSKGYVLNKGVEGLLSLEYGLWGYLNDNIYKFFNFFIGNHITGLQLMNYLIAFQLSVYLFFQKNDQFNKSICYFFILKSFY